MKKEASRRQPSLPLNASIRGASKARIVASPSPQYPPPWRKKESTNLRLSRCTPAPLCVLDMERIGCEDSKNPGRAKRVSFKSGPEWIRIASMGPWKDKLKVEPRKEKINKSKEQRERENVRESIIADRRLIKDEQIAGNKYTSSVILLLSLENITLTRLRIAKNAK